MIFHSMRKLSYVIETDKITSKQIQKKVYYLKIAYARDNR